MLLRSANKTRKREYGNENYLKFCGRNSSPPLVVEKLFRLINKRYQNDRDGFRVRDAGQTGVSIKFVHFNTCDFQC